MLRQTLSTPSPLASENSTLDPFHLSVLAAVRDYLLQNGIWAEMIRIVDGGGREYAVVDTWYKEGHSMWSGNLSVVDGCVRMADHEPLPLALPDSLDTLVCQIKNCGKQK